MNAPYREKLEVLSVDLLQRNRSLVVDLKKLAHSLGLEFGWHYLLDISWILSQLGEVGGCRLIDAGAGTGVIQWYLAQQGARVISVDRSSRANLPLRFRARFQVHGLRTEDLQPNGQVFRENWTRQATMRVKFASQTRDLLALTHGRKGPGEVLIYNQDLKNLVDIPTGSLDAVVAVSALEHNSPEGLQQVVAELLRVLKPGGVILATLNAAPGRDWWHEPSSGWCYTAESLQQLFDLSPETPHNYDQYDQLLEELRGCRELSDNLAQFYFRSGDNGMPWGKWDPQYVPVGVCKIKRTDSERDKNVEEQKAL